MYFDIICWLQANDWSTLVSSYVELSRDIDFTAVGAPPFEDGLDDAIIAQRMIKWFEKQRSLKWLLIFDNADKIDDPHESHSIVELIPRGDTGCVLATSRNRASDGELANGGYEVEEMMENDAVDFLLLCSRHDESQKQDAQTLVRVLGCLPLAIEQAGCYIRTKRISISRYVALYEMNKTNALKQELPLSHEVYYKHTVLTTWKISFDEVDVRDPLASEILRLMAFLDGTKIQIELFEAGGKSLTADWRLSKATVFNIEDSLGCLLSFSLVRRLMDNDISIHVLVQQVMQERLQPSGHLFASAALKLVGSQFPWGGDLQNFSVCLKYMPQAKICIENYPASGAYSDDWFQLAASLASFFYNNGEYEAASTGYERTLRIIGRSFGVDRINTADTINNLGSTYGKQGKYDEAIAQYERALRIKEKAFGVDHINTAGTINNLGSTYDNQGKYDEAIAQYERALRIYEKAFGVDHINTAHTINNLGNTYRNQGKYDEAIAQYERALRIYEKAFGVDHINTANTINNLGSTYDKQGKYDKAIAQYERALRIYEKAFGVDHINTADTINNLGNTYDNQGKYDEAIAQYERALRIKEKVFGVDHINTAHTINNLGITYDNQGKYDEAIAQYERALRIKEKAFGVDHINTAGTIMNVGISLQRQGDLQNAKQQYMRGYQIFHNNLGALHPDTLKAKSLLDLCLENIERGGKYDTAHNKKRKCRWITKVFGSR